MKKNRILIYPLIIMGALIIFTFSCKYNRDSNTVQDIDGNVYTTVTIGTQTWMAENLKTTKYRNGDPIPNIADDIEWGNLSTGAYCDYENTPNNNTNYGRLYNWHTVNDSRNLAPIGWHVSTDAEWTILITYLGGKEVAGGKLKEIGLTLWLLPNIGATNETGFTGLLGGHRYHDGEFGGIGFNGSFWSSTQFSTTKAWYCYLGSTYTEVGRYLLTKGNGLSVRCLKDN